MRLPEFIGGLLFGFSVYITVLSTFYLLNISKFLGSTNGVLNQAYFELLIPFGAAIVAGLGIGFGIKSDDSSGYNINFSDWSEHWPVLIGGVGLAASLGSLLVLYVSGTPTSGLIYSLISIILCLFGTIIAILNWETNPY